MSGDEVEPWEQKTAKELKRGIHLFSGINGMKVSNSSQAWGILQLIAGSLHFLPPAFIFHVSLMLFWFLNMINEPFSLSLPFPDQWDCEAVQALDTNPNVQ